MEDKWRKFANENRDEFEKDSPKDLFFEKIAPVIKFEKTPKMVRLSVVWQMAAAILVLFGITLFFLMSKDDSVNKNKTAKETKIKDNRFVLANVNPELAETEYYYVTQIDQLMQEVESRHLTPEIKEILEQLDGEFKMLQKEMGENVNKDQIIEALIENYRLKIKLLEKILNSYETNTDEKENKNPA